MAPDTPTTRGIKQAVGTDANYFFDVDPISIWDTNPKSLKPELPPMIQMVGDAYLKAKPDTIIKSPHVGMAASNTYLFLADVLPRAIKKYGGVNADALRKAALRHRCAGGRHDARLRRQVRSPRAQSMAGRTTAPSRWSSSTSTTRPTWSGRSRSSSASRC